MRQAIVGSTGVTERELSPVEEAALGLLTPAEALALERAQMAVSRFQARAALMQAGLLDAVEQAVREADALTQMAWAEAVELRRTSPAIAALAAAVGLTQTQLDVLFRSAMTIEA